MNNMTVFVERALKSKLTVGISSGVVSALLTVFIILMSTGVTIGGIIERSENNENAIHNLEKRLDTLEGDLKTQLDTYLDNEYGENSERETQLKVALEQTHINKLQIHELRLLLSRISYQ
ncbi:hypothetical protein [Vibrio sp. MEBiC08052]|uniref:hypothetical protein n=1 Tax=Vibrio sp. MEBiC08052 TaxID=1761910 RepID=UPI0012F82F97|nr:hypothetical protein [Vibrio sp. MEBiC08052]